MTAFFRFLALVATFCLAARVPAAEPAGKASPTPAEPVPVPTVITSTFFDMRSTDKEAIVIFDKNVEVIGTNLKITCDHLEVVTSRIGDVKAAAGKLDKFKSLIAVGRVHIVQGDREVICGRAEVFPAEEKIILTESPVVIDNSGPFTMTGTKLEVRRGERQVFGENIKFTGPEMGDLGFDKNKPFEKPKETPVPAAPSGSKQP